MSGRRAIGGALAAVAVAIGFTALASGGAAAGGQPPLRYKVIGVAGKLAADVTAGYGQFGCDGKASSLFTGSIDGRRPGKPLGTNGKAIASLVTALAGLVFCGLPSIAGLILGIIAMRECRRSGQDGYGLALAGTIIGGLITALVVLYFVFVIGLAASGWQWAP